MKDTFTLADLANFKLPEAGSQSAAPASQSTESSTVETAPNDEVVETSVEGSDPSSDTAETVTGGTESPETVSETEAPQAKAKGGKTASEYIAELKEERSALRRLNEYLLSKDQAPQPAATAPTADAKPTLEAHGFDVLKYEQAMEAWASKQSEVAKTQGAQQAIDASVKATFEARLAEFSKVNPAAKTVFSIPNNLPALATEAQAMVVESDIGPQVLYHLLANPDQAVRIAKKTPAQQTADIGRIEGELLAKSKQKTPQITRAPNPPTPTQGRGNTPSVDPSKMSTKEWILWDRQQENERRRAQSARSA